jgi:N-acetyl sugar amidotransferase
MRYCRTCWIPDTKPHTTFDAAGVCSACTTHAAKQAAESAIDWSRRAADFDTLVAAAKSRQAPFYDVLVPVSGGKDSITQVHRLLGKDLRILAAHVDYGIKTDIGWRNLQRIPDMGANLVIYRPELTLHRCLVRLGFEDFGDPDLLSHTMLHAYPLHVALRFQIPLVLLGENSAFEYGGDDELAARNSMNRAWFARYAANSGMDARFVSKRYDIPYERLRLYDFPDELESSGTQAVFMSYYFFWDSEAHLEIARQHGFESLDQPSEGTYRNFVGIDEKINRVHQYFKVLKFGYGRATDHACEDIRNGRRTREEARELIRRHDLEPLSDGFVDDFAAFAGITREQVFAVMDRYRNADIWRQSPDGRWHVEGHLEETTPIGAMA